MLLYSKPNNKINKFAKNWLYFFIPKLNKIFLNLWMHFWIDEICHTSQENNKILNQWNEIIEIKTKFSLSVGTFNDLKLCIEIK